MTITRRVFLRNSALAVVGTAAVPKLSDARRDGRGSAGHAHKAPGGDISARCS